MEKLTSRTHDALGGLKTLNLARKGEILRGDDFFLMHLAIRQIRPWLRLPSYGRPGRRTASRTTT
eukprot:1395395-Amorphochlora_amoeboformis.AAC.1